MKGFYRQRKNPTANKSSTSSKSKKKISKAAEETPDYSLAEEVLRMFDMNMKYGPCLGMTRLQRWERADQMGLNPPQQIKLLLEKSDKVQSECLWHNLSTDGGCFSLEITSQGTFITNKRKNPT